MNKKIFVIVLVSMFLIASAGLVASAANYKYGMMDENGQFYQSGMMGSDNQFYPANQGYGMIKWER